MRPGAGTEPDGAAARTRQRHGLPRPEEADRSERLGAAHLRVAGEQRGDAVRHLVSELVDARIRHLRHVEPREAATRVDHVRRRGVVDHPLHDRRLDAVIPPDALQLRQRAGQEAPLVHHAMRLGVGPHPLDLCRLRVRADPQELHLSARRAEQLLRVQQRGRCQRADGRALGIVDARTTTFPRSERRETRLPNWSVSVNAGAAPSSFVPGSSCGFMTAAADWAGRVSGAAGAPDEFTTAIAAPIPTPTRSAAPRTIA